ncbi:MAG: serine/threonine-protein kinase, partial [Planctomycetota bacterium]
MAKRETEFARTAITLKLVSQQQAQECLTLYAQRRKSGERLQLADVFVEKGYLSTAQVGQVVQAMRQPRISHIGRYKLLAKIGQGGMGTVYKARQESLDKIVALKVLAPGLAKQEDYVERFIREAQSSGQLNHPNIVLGIDAGEADGYYYFAMEFVDGENVKALLQRQGKLDERGALAIALAMAKALEHAAEHHIVHRDIKPGNILIASDDTPKLADLGLAKEVRGDHSITQAGIPVGTPYYISPEQVRGQEQVDIRADIYALGGTLYHMVTGEVPYDGPTAAVVMTRHLNDDIPDPREHVPGLSNAIVAIIHRCMAKAPDDRYRSPAQLREDLEAALAGKPLRHARRIGARVHRAA